MVKKIKETPVLDHVVTDDLESHAYRIEVLEQAFEQDLISEEEHVNALRQERIVYTNKRLAEGQDALQINDLVFAMPRITTPPVAIRIDKQNLNYSWQTLRTKASAKTTSGHGNTRISFSLYFVGTAAISAGLRRLLACFEATPFVYIENRFIRENLAPGTLLSSRDSGEMAFESMAASLLNISVHTEPGLSNVLVADVDLLWFNYKPYSPNFWFRQTWEATEEFNTMQHFGKVKDGKPVSVSAQGEAKAEGSGELVDGPVYSIPLDPDLPLTQASPPVMFPEFSVPLVERINRAERNFSVVTSLHSAMAFRYWTYETLSSAEQMFAEQQFLRPEVVRDLDTTYIQANPSYEKLPVLKLQNQAADSLEKLAKAFWEKWDLRLTINSCFRTREEQLRLRKKSKFDPETGTYVAAEWSWHETGLAVDIATRRHGMNYEKWRWLVENAKKNGLSNLGLRMAEARGLEERFWQSSIKQVASEVGGAYGNVALGLLEFAGINPAKALPPGIKNALDRVQYASFTESWHFDFLKGQKEAKKEYESSFASRSDKSLSLTQFTIKNIAQSLYIHEKGTEISKIKEALEDQLEEKKPGKTAWEIDSSSSSSSIVFKRREELLIAEDDKELIPQGISISKHNMIAQLPVLGHEFATQQYLGSTDMDAVINFIAVKGGKLAELQKMNSVLQANGRGSRQAREASVIQIYGNPIFDLLGFEHAFIESISVESIPGSPELYNVSIQLSQYKRTVPPDLQQEFVIEAEGHERLFAETFYKAMVFSTGAGGIHGLGYDGLSGFQATSTHILRLIKLGDAAPPSIVEFFEKAAATEAKLIWARARMNQDPSIDETSTEMFFSDPALTMFSELGLDMKNEKDIWLLDHLKRRSMPYIIFGNHKVPSLSPTSASIIGNALHNNGALKTHEASWQRVISLYSSALMMILLRGKVSIETLDLLGIPGSVFSLDVEITRERNLAGEELKQEIALFRELQVLLQAAVVIIIRDKLITHSIFRHLYYSQSKLLRRYAEGLAAYPDLDLPPHPATDSVLDTDADYYFYNPPSLKASQGSGFRRTILDRALSVAQKTYDSFGIHCSKAAYDTDILSFNKFSINNTVYRFTGNKAKLTDAEFIGALKRKSGHNDFIKKEEKRAAAAFFHEGELGLKNSFAIKSDRIGIINDILHPTNLKEPFQKGQVKGSVDILEFGQAAGGFFDPGERKDKEAKNLKDVIDSSWEVFDDTTFRMARAFPTFKIYFIEDDTDEETYRIKDMKNFDDFYSYSAIKDIRIVRSRKIPADLCVISISNVHGELDFLQYASQETGGPQRVKERFDPAVVDTTQENPFERLVVVEGSKIQLRLGYSSNPSNLETVFNGQVVEVALSPISPDIVQLVCQSYGVELVAEMKGAEGKKEQYDSTQELLSSMICSPELKHFGRWSPTGLYDPKRIRTSYSDNRASGLFDEFIEDQKWSWLMEDTFKNAPQDDNIFAPDYDDYADGWGSFDKALDWIGLKVTSEWLNLYKDDRTYHPYYNTIWDIFQEMTLRHPGFIASLVPYSQRYTMFFGPPTQRYWARPMTTDEERRSQEAEAWAKRYIAFEDRRTQGWRSKLSTFAQKGLRINGRSILAVDLLQQAETELRQKRAEQIKHEAYGRYERFRPFRNYWTLTSENHIIANNLRVSSHGTYNAVNLTYFSNPNGYELQESNEKAAGGITGTVTIAEAIESNATTLKIKADDNIEDKDTRVMNAEYFSCYGDFFARRYCAALLMRSLRDVYKGEIVTIGNPKIKPYDVCYLYDSYNDIFGPVEVEQVTHIFSQETGFITEIKPDLIVSHNDWTTQCTLDAMQIVTSELAKKAGEAIGLGATETLALGGLTAGLAGGSVGFGILAFGGYKFIQWTQERQPIVITPLIKRHKPLLGGVDGFKFDSTIVNLAGKWERWIQDVQDGYEAFLRSAPFQTWYREFTSSVVNKLGN